MFALSPSVRLNAVGYNFIPKMGKTRSKSGFQDGGGLAMAV
ncbi:hypothetical protein [Paenibacillus sp. N3.4]|nr:hypothetical protein [Paenibacillus sp. N3.4]